MKIRIKKRKFNNKLALVLMMVVSTMFIVGLVRLGGRVEAQIEGFGIACTNKAADCNIGPNGSLRNLSVSLANGTVKITNANGLNASRIQTSIEANIAQLTDVQRLPNYEEMCIFNGIQEIFPAVVMRAVGAEPAGELPAYNNQPDYYITARGCGPSLDVAVKQMESTLADNTIDRTPPMTTFYGCCPIGSSLVPGLIETGASLVQINPALGGCCTIPTNAQPGDPNYPEAVDSRGHCITTKNPSQRIFPLTDALNFYNNGKDVGTTLGINTNIVADIDVSGASKSCSNLTKNDQGVPQGCALVEDDGTGAVDVGGTTIESNGKTYKVVSAAQMEQSETTGLQCNKCYEDDDPIIVDGLSGTGTTPTLLLCDTSSSSGLNIRREPLINNSIADTLATLRAQDSTNADFIRQCTAGGGIPTAIGCVDPSPLGIITGLIRIALGVIGGVALIQLILVGIMYQRGNEEEIKKARERLIAILTGVAFLVFSVLILRILGVNILDVIPAGSI